MRFSRITKLVLILALAALVLPLSTNLAPRVHAYPPYSLTPVPASTAEGNTIGLVLSNAGAVQSEAGRIESSDFFQSVKDQVKKEKDEK